MPFLRPALQYPLCCFLSLAVGCAPAAVSRVTARAVAVSPPVKAPGSAKVGDLALCPVQGQTFRVSAESAHAEWEGKTYYFCCEDCLEDFLKSPQAYIGTR